MLNYLVTESLVNIKGSGIASAIVDHMTMLRGIVPVRLVIIKESPYEVVIDIDVDMIFIDGPEVTEIDGGWYAHSERASLLLSQNKIKHLYQFHNGDLLVNEHGLSIEKELRFRDAKARAREFRIMSLPWSTVVCQTQAIADKLKPHGVEALVAKMPIYVEKVESEKYYDLVVSGSITALKGLPWTLPALKDVKDKRIAVICSIPGGFPKGTVISDEFRARYTHLTGRTDIDDYDVDWYFGATRKEVQHIIASSHRFMHGSFIECYPYLVMEASQYTTVLSNKYASYIDHIGVKTIPIDIADPEAYFQEPLGPTLDLVNHNREGKLEWKRLIAKNMKLLQLTDTVAL